MSNRLGGKQGTAYVGTNANQPPNLTYLKRHPGMYDVQNYSLGDVVLDTTDQTLWYLASLAGDSYSKGSLATWIQIGGSSVVETSYITDAGTAVPASNILNVNGSTNINTTGSGNTIHVNLNTTLTGLSSVTTTNLTTTNLTTDNLTATGTVTLPSMTTLTVPNLVVTNSETFSNLGQGVVQSSSSGVISSSEGTDGQVLISSSTGAPVWANLTAGTNVTITNGHNSISIASSGGMGGSGVVLLATQNLAGLTSFNFNEISSTYASYLLVIDNLEVTTGSPTQITIAYTPAAAFTGYNNWTGGVNYSAYNSTTVTNISTSGGSGSSYLAPVFGTGVAQYISLNAYLYNISSTDGFPKLITGQCAIYSGSSLYQGIISAAADTTSPPVAAVTSINITASGLTITSGTAEFYGLTV
jgi:hypothetical protein